MKSGKVAAYSLVLAACLLTACAGREIFSYNTSQVAMGCVVSQVYYGTRPSDMEKQGEKVAELVRHLEQDVISRRLESSELYKINKEADSQEVTVSETMAAYLEKAMEVSERSDGAFDMTIGEVVRLWNVDAAAAGEEGFFLPTDEEIATALSLSGYDKVYLDGTKVTCENGIYLDMGAIGKGIACDEIYALVKDGKMDSVKGGIVSVGGSIVAIGEKPDGTDYRVSIVHPRQEGRIGVVAIRDGEFLSTSGDYERYVMYEGKRYHHIIDPKTGYPAKSGICSVTVVTKSGLLSDALSTACFVLGEEAGLALAESYEAKVMMVREDNSIVMNDRMRTVFTAQ